MSEPFVGEIRMFAGSFAPRSWAFCDGQLMAISQNDALFSLLGTIYGGDGRTTFALPDLRGRIPIHQGSGPGLSSRSLGARGGSEKVTLTVNQIPSHTHTFTASDNLASDAAPGGKVLARQADDFYNPDTATASMGANSISSTGNSGSHDNLMPYLCINFIIALFGIYPSRQ
ncbi:Phage Tail Collar Domain protein [Pseudovibrio axinellae]|uniref:Phage Tail Collar Domain protein n=1 Tax=Pseudovibrio axinellae TaxID=989403 RepID=A0A165UPP7_9HYPH|nr:tail fiber protein [Pseudovibrio axinellae]KZL12670.1 Phage Tail Collar Domain protein [Pseudovibrio axinellae]SEP62183.1 Microcystin-dependent protein [Pseudovibrio axinellae]